jgi:hypothetical protein
MQIEGATNLSVTLDGVAIKIPPRVQSKVFAVAVPTDNVFGLSCLQPGIYSPAAGDGFYVLLAPPSLGNHTLHFHADNPQTPRKMLRITLPLCRITAFRAFRTTVAIY